MSHTRFRFLHKRSRPKSGQRSNSCLSHNSETTEANLIKHHRNIEHNEKVCHAQDLDSYAQGQDYNWVIGPETNLMKLHRKIKHNEKVCSYAQGQAHNRVRGQICVSAISETTKANLMKLHRKIKHNEKVCHAQDLGSYAQGQGHNRVRGQIRVTAITQKLLKQI